jgi:hypothetical protein
MTTEVRFPEEGTGVLEQLEAPPKALTGDDGADDGGDEVHSVLGGIGGGDGARLAQFLDQVMVDFTEIAGDLDRLLGVNPEWAEQARAVWRELAERVPRVSAYLRTDNPDTQLSNLAAHGLAGRSLDAKLAGFARARIFRRNTRDHEDPRARKVGIRELIRWSKSILDSLINVVKTNTAARAILETLDEGIDLIGNLINDVEDEDFVSNL